MSLTPPVGVTGIYSLATPWASEVVQNTPYTCIAVRKFADIIRKGEDPYQVYYASKGLTQAQYLADFNADEKIVTLRSAAGQFIYVPTSKILSYPNQSGVPYTALVLGVRIGAIPNTLNLSALNQKIVDVCRDYLGVTPTIQQVAISDTQVKSAADHAALEAARQANIRENQTDYAKLQAANTTIAAQAQLIAQLQLYIQQNLPPNP